MARALSAFYEAEVQKKSTRPGWLIEILLDTPLRLCTSGQATWEGHSWIATGAAVLWAPGGLPTIRLMNHDTSGTALIKAGNLLDTPVSIQSWYPSEARPNFQGFLRLGKADYRFTYFVGSFSRSSGTRAPGMRVVEPTFTQRLTPGGYLFWQNYTLEVTS